MLVFAYHFLTNSLPSPYHFLTNCYMRRIGSKMWAEPFWGWWCLHTISLPIPYHVLIISLPTVTCVDLTAICEGSHFGVAGVCIPFPYQFLTMSLRFPYQLLHAQNWQQDVRGAILGLLVVAYQFLTMSSPFPYHFLTISLTFPYHLLHV